MTNEIAQYESSLPVDLSGIPTDELRRELASAIGLTARTLGRLAMIWHELELRGEDLSALRGGGLFAYLPVIAAGSLDPEVVVRCAGQATVIKALAAMPIEVQRRVLTNGIPLATVAADGSIVETVKQVEALTVADIRAGIAGTELRPVAAQIGLLSPARRRKPVQRGVIVKIRLTQEEHEVLRREAARRGQTTPIYARDRLLGKIVDGAV